MTRMVMLAAIAAIGLGLPGCKSGDDVEMFSARLEASQVVPAPQGSATGEAGFTFDGQTLAFSMDLGNVESVTSPNRFLRFAIYAGAPGTLGAPLVRASASSPSIVGRRLLWHGSFGEDGLVAAGSMQEVLSEMRAGGAYAQLSQIEIHAVGESALPLARGQIVAVR